MAFDKRHDAFSGPIVDLGCSFSYSFDRILSIKYSTKLTNWLPQSAIKKWKYQAMKCNWFHISFIVISISLSFHTHISFKCKIFMVIFCCCFLNLLISFEFDWLAICLYMYFLLFLGSFQICIGFFLNRVGHFLWWTGKI